MAIGRVIAESARTGADCADTGPAVIRSAAGGASGQLGRDHRRHLARRESVSVTTFVIWGLLAIGALDVALVLFMVRWSRWTARTKGRP